MGKERLVAALFFLSGAMGCGLGGSLPPVEPGIGEDDGELMPPAFSTPALHVAQLHTTIPPMNSFLLRGNFPVPKGTFPRSDGKIPFTIRDYDGTPVWTQVQVVTYYPDVSDGADVVEVIGRVRRNPSHVPGFQTHYDVWENLTDPPLSPGDPNIGDLARTRSVLPLMEALFTDPEAIVIRAWDVFGHEYRCQPLDGTGDIQHRRNGPAQTELRIYQTMLPVQPVSGPQGTLPHLFGVHAYVSSYTGQEIAGLDLRFHNGHTGLDPLDPADDPLDKVYFNRIEVTLPETYLLHTDFEDPFWQAPYRSSGRRIAPIVKPNPDGRPHVMKWQSQFHRRLMISTTAAADIARAYMAGAGHAFCQRGLGIGYMNDLYSWWNPETARYFPQNHLMPSLDHVGLDTLRSDLEEDHDWLEEHLLLGTPTLVWDHNTGEYEPNYPIGAGVMGWMHPYGVAYGGMTGGPEIFLYDGIQAAAAASIKGYRFYEGVHRMHSSRHPTALYNLDGQPTRVEDWLVDVGPGIENDYVPMWHYMIPNLGINFSDPFGFHDAPQHQIDYVEQTGFQPTYEAQHLAYEPHDLHHLIRYTRSAKVLQWLGNDSIAKDDLRMQAENVYLSYHPYNNNPNGAWISTGMKTALRHIELTPGIGLGFGRGESWGADTMIAAYAAADPSWRAGRMTWFEDLARILGEGQGACNGFIQSQVSPKFVNGLYRARQLIEQSITENMMFGLRSTVFTDVDPGNEALVEDTLVDSLYAFISPMAWFPGVGAPWTYTGIAPLDSSLPIWCSMAEMPPDSYTPATDTFQDWSSFAYGYELTGDSTFLDFALLQSGGSHLLNRLEDDGTWNLENRAATLALLQHMNGDL